MALALAAVGWCGNAFTPLVSVYHRDLGVDATALNALFAAYAVGLIPGLLIGGAVADRRGRRPPVLLFTAASAVATVLVMLAPATAWALLPARALAGTASGVVFAAGSAWVQELSSAVGDGEAAPRRTALALSSGFAAGPLVTSALAAVVPAPLVIAYIPHLILIGLALLGLRTVRETVTVPAGRSRGVPVALRTLGFWREVGPLAPWVFGCATTAFVVLPGLLGGVPVVLAGLITASTLAFGIAVQPLARGLCVHAASLAGLAATVGGLTLGSLAVTLHAPPLLAVTTPVLGAGYGLLLVAGLRLTERHADAAERGAFLAPSTPSPTSASPRPRSPTSSGSSSLRLWRCWRPRGLPRSAPLRSCGRHQRKLTAIHLQRRARSKSPNLLGFLTRRPGFEPGSEGYEVSVSCCNSVDHQAVPGVPLRTVARLGHKIGLIRAVWAHGWTHGLRARRRFCLETTGAR